MKSLKKLSDCISPLSWLCVAFVVIPSLLIVLKPSFYELVVFHLVDWVALQFSRRFEVPFFISMYPDSRPFFEGIDSAAVRNMNTEARVRLIQSAIDFPKRRARHAFLASFVKAIPAFVVMVFFWEREYSYLVQGAVLLGIFSLIFTYFYGAVYIESHLFLSEKIREFHDEVDLSEAFEQVTFAYSKREFEKREVSTLIFLVVFMVGLQLTVVLNFQDGRQISELAIMLLVIGVSTAVLFCRIWYLSRKYFVGGLEALFFKLEHIHYGNASAASLALHTSPLLAQFERTYNGMSRRIEQNERDLKELAVQSAEQSRYRTLGEMSALIAHDLSSPLHCLQFYVTELQQSNPSGSKAAVYIERMNTNLQRAMDLLYSLRAKIRNPSVLEKRASVAEAFQHVHKLLAIQFRQERFGNVRFVWDDRLDGVELAITTVDLIHVLENILRNCVENLLKHSVEIPCIEITRIMPREESPFATIQIRDNGSGLDSQAFEQLTSLGSGRSQQLGLGLKLTRRLVEMNHGTLRLIEESGRLSGTCFEISLPIQQVPSLDIGLITQNFTKEESHERQQAYLGA